MLARQGSCTQLALPPCADGWRKAGKPRLRVTVVGEGTGRELPAELGDNLQLAFTPSKVSPKACGC